MPFSRRTVLGVALTAGLATPALPHSLEELEQEFVQSEKYFQPVDKEAPGFTLQDAGGRGMSLADFKGKVVVLNFIYIDCPDFCPLQSEKIAEIQKMVNISPMKTMVEFISITTDHKRDFGRALKDYGESHGLDPVNWMFLTAAPGAPEDSTRELAKAYGVEFKLAADGEQMHGVVTSVIDQEGRLVGRFHGLQFQNLSLVKFVNALTNHHDNPKNNEPGFWDRLKAWF
jgi:protein SCO1/2